MNSSGLLLCNIVLPKKGYCKSLGFLLHTKNSNCKEYSLITIHGRYFIPKKYVLVFTECSFPVFRKIPNDFGPKTRDYNIGTRDPLHIFDTVRT